MISQECYELGSKSSVIREIFSYGLKRKAEVGEDKVYDFSLGNPSIPAPESVKKAILELLELPPEKIHAYSPAPGDPKVRTAIAESLNRRFGETFRMDNIFMTCGAAASLNICLKALLNAGEEAITFAPFFPEYRVWVEGVGAALNVIPAKLPDFQIDAEAFEQAITPKTKVVIVNTPNNPSGVVYSEETIRNLCAILKKKSEEYDKEKANLLDNVRQRRETELQDLYNRIQQSYQDNQKSLQETSQQKMQAISDKMLGVIKQIGTEGGYVYIMDVSAGIPYISTTLSTDVTADIKQKLGLK